MAVVLQRRKRDPRLHGQAFVPWRRSRGRDRDSSCTTAFPGGSQLREDSLKTHCTSLERKWTEHQSPPERRRPNKARRPCCTGGQADRTVSTPTTRPLAQEQSKRCEGFVVAATVASPAKTKAIAGRSVRSFYRASALPFRPSDGSEIRCVYDPTKPGGRSIRVRPNRALMDRPCRRCEVAGLSRRAFDTNIVMSSS